MDYPALAWAASQGALFGVVVFVVLTFLRTKGTCPECNSALPTFRRPKNLNQALWGGTTCPKCGVELNRCNQKLSTKC